MNSSQIIFRRGGGSRRNAVEGLSLKRRIRILVAAGAASALAVTGSVVVPQNLNVVPAAVAQEGNDNASDEPAAQQGDSFANAIEADAVKNQYIRNSTDATNAANTLSGRAYVWEAGGMASTDTANRAVPEGTIVYMQWMDTDGAVSPIYSAKTTDQMSSRKGSQVGPGFYGFDLREPWVDGNGKEHTYTASTNQYYRAWVNPFLDERSGQTVFPFRQNGGFFPSAFRNSVGADQNGAFNVIGKNMQRTAVFMKATPGPDYLTLPRDQWREDKTEVKHPMSSGTYMRKKVGGRAWIETADTALTGPSKDNSEPGARGFKVVMSYLTPEGISQFQEKVEPLPKAERPAAAKELLTDYPEYIAETAYSEVDADGYYTIEFGEQFTQETKKYMYGYLEDSKGNPVQSYSAWPLQTFTSPGDRSVAPATDVARGAPKVNEIDTSYANWYDVNFAVVPSSRVSLEIVDYNDTDQPAPFGSVVNLKVEGPFPNLPNKIVWKDNQGNVLKTCEEITNETKANDCSLDLGEVGGVKKGDLFRAEFMTGNDTVIAADSFIVDDSSEDSRGDAVTTTPSWENKQVAPGGEVTIPNTGDPIPDGSKVAAVADQRGWSVSTDDKGELTVKAPEGAKDGDKTTVTVQVTYPDGSKDVEEVTVTVKDPNAGTSPKPKSKQATELTPNWDNAETAPGKAVEVRNNGDEIPADATTAVSVTPREGNQGEAPWTAEIGDDGTVTVTPGEDAKPGDKVEVTVEVTYKDRSKDIETFTVTVTDKESDKTSVTGEPAEVEDKDEDQNTGLKVENKDEDTEVTAKDEDGNDVPVTIGDDGTITVNPGQTKDKDGKDVKVDGPITVTVTDPDLPDGKAEFEVPVKDHEKGRDDNNSDESGKTTVDTENVKPVDPTNDEQDTGIDVKNPGEDTEVSAKDEDGKDVPARIDEDGNVVVTPGEDVDGPITVIIEDPDLDGGKTEVEVPVNGHEKGRDDNGNGTPAGDDNTGSSEPADIGKCIAAGVGLGLPLLLLAPLGLAGQVNLPGVSQWQAQIEPQIRELNTRLQQEAGIFNPELARMAEEFNAQMARPEVRAAVGGIGLLLAGLAIGGIMLNACAPEGGYGSPGSSDLKSIGSGENESEGSSQPEAEDANGEDAAAEEEVTDPEAEEATDEDTTDPEA